MSTERVARGTPPAAALTAVTATSAPPAAHPSTQRRAALQAANPSCPSDPSRQLWLQPNPAEEPRFRTGLFSIHF